MASLDKKPIVVSDPKTGEKVKTRSKKWRGRYRDEIDRDRRVPLSTDKRAAQVMLNTLVEKVERRKAGIDDTTDDEMGRRIEQHIVDFDLHLKGKNNMPRYVDELVTKVRRFVKTLRWRTVA